MKRPDFKDFHKDADVINMSGHHYRFIQEQEKYITHLESKPIKTKSKEECVHYVEHVFEYDACYHCTNCRGTWSANDHPEWSQVQKEGDWVKWDEYSTTKHISQKEVTMEMLYHHIKSFGLHSGVESLESNYLFTGAMIKECAIQFISYIKRPKDNDMVFSGNF